MSRIRLDLRLVAAAGLALLAGLGVWSLTRPPERVTVLVAAETLPAGMPLRDLALQEASVEPLSGLILAEEAAEFADWTLSVPVSGGSPLTAAVLLPPPGLIPDMIALTLEREHAVQGSLEAGDLVDVYVTDETGTRLLAESITVISAELGAEGFGGIDVALLLAVDDLLAPALIEATQTASIDLVLVATT
jgi:hypothetical protein